MILRAIEILVIGYILHATCRPRIPLAARALLLATAGVLIYLWFRTNIIEWIQAKPVYVIIGVIAVGVLMVAWAKYLQRHEDGQDAATNEATNTAPFPGKPNP
jgi:hypothetical protein